MAFIGSHGKIVSAQLGTPLRENGDDLVEAASHVIVSPNGRPRIGFKTPQRAAEVLDTTADRIRAGRL